MKGLVIALHDVAPSTLAETRRWRALVAEVTDGPVSLLVVPRYRGRESWRSGRARGWVRSRHRDGDELVLHGYSHLDREGRDGRELFGRTGAAISALIEDGLLEMELSGLDTEGFIAPSYLHPDEAHESCRSAGLGWWATRSFLHSRIGTRGLPSLGLGASTRSRRVLSPLVARSAARLVASVPVVRLDLHPADLRHPRMERAGRDLLTRLLAQGRSPITHGRLTT